MPTPYAGNVVRHTEEISRWLALTPRETALEPDLPIIDAHHHLWDVKAVANRYLLDDLLQDIALGHDIRATVYVEGHAMYRSIGPDPMKPVGEVEFANGVAAMAASGIYGGCRVAEAIVGHADLMLGSAVREVLEAQVSAAGGRFRGIRYALPHDAHDSIARFISRPVPAHRMADPVFLEGFTELAALGLNFDAWMYHPQLPDLLQLADRFDRTQIILDHVGTPLGVGPYAGKRDDVFSRWSGDMRQLAARKNITVKLGGLGMPVAGFALHLQARPPSSEDLANAWRPCIETCIELFGAERCMFESNFPVDKQSCGYSELWNAFKRLTAGCSNAERSALFSGTASRVYRMTDPAAS
ncbi:MAG: amidohydrolase [Comamonadaceae bacterium]|nr:MAG: amidohydrolase [Comamonadaceae bacterium]